MKGFGRRPLGEHTRNAAGAGNAAPQLQTRAAALQAREKGNSNKAAVQQVVAPIGGERVTGRTADLALIHHGLSQALLNKRKKALLDVVGFESDMIAYMLSYEKTDEFAVENMYILSTQHLQPKMRSILIDWIVQVQQRFTLLPETLHLTVYLLDKFLCLSRDVSKTELQLVGTTCMFIASKFEEMYPPMLSDFEYMADNAFGKRDIIRMEMRILDTIGFNLGRPNAVQFLDWYCLSLGYDAKKSAVHKAKYFNELCLLDVALAHLYPSQLAAASLFLAIYITEHKDIKEMLAQLSYTPLEELKGTIELVVGAIARVMSQSKLAAIRGKYATVKQGEASKLNAQEEERLRSLLPKYTEVSKGLKAVSGNVQKQHLDVLKDKLSSAVAGVERARGHAH